MILDYRGAYYCKNNYTMAQVPYNNEYNLDYSKCATNFNKYE